MRVSWHSSEAIGASKRTPNGGVGIGEEWPPTIEKVLCTAYTRDVEITAAVIAMAHKLNLRVVAEGVNSQAQLDFLRDHGCDAAQGHLFGEASPIDALDLSNVIRG